MIVTPNYLIKECSRSDAEKPVHNRTEAKKWNQTLLQPPYRPSRFTSAFLDTHNDASPVPSTAEEHIGMSWGCGLEL